MIAQIIFVVWRESIEALLIIGILQAWLRHNGSASARLHLWGGVLAGGAGAVALSWLLTRFGESLPPEGHDIFQMALMLAAAGLVVQMVLWMRRRGRTLKRELETGLSGRLAEGRLWGIFALAMIAVMREGAEAAIFLQGIIAATGWTLDATLAIGAAFGAALASYGLLQLGGRFLSWRHFFRLTEVMLLLLACALFVNGAGYLVSLGVLPYTHPLWDLSGLLDDARPLGAVVAALTGYRASPDVVTLASWLVYWGGIAFAFRRQALRPAHA